MPSGVYSRVPKDYCKNGHEFTEENTYVRPSNGKRACRVCARKKANNWRAKHPDKVSAVLHNWYENNKEYVKAANIKWQEANPERYLEAKRDWMRAHPELGRRNARRRRALKKSHLGLWWKFELLIIPLLRQAQKELCYYCSKRVDTNLPPQHPDREVLEHPMPLSRGGSHGIDNWVLSCFECNASKGNKTAVEFLENRNVRKSRPRAEI